MVRITVNKKGFDAFDKDLNPVEGAYVQIQRRNDDEGVKTNLPNLPVDMTGALTRIVKPLIDLNASLDIDVYGLENFDLIFSAGPMFNAIRDVVDDEVSSIRSENFIKMSREGKFAESRLPHGHRLNERKTYSVFADVSRGGQVEYRYSGTEKEARQFAESLNKRTFKGYQIVDPDGRMLKESKLPSLSQIGRKPQVTRSNIDLSNYRAKFIETGFEPVDEIVDELGFEQGMEYDLKDIALRLFDGMVNTEEWTFGASTSVNGEGKQEIDIMVFDADGDKVGDLFFEMTTEVDDITMIVIFDKLNDMLVNGN